MTVDYEALRGGVTTGVPENGSHTARLERAKLWEGDRGSQLITEWSENGLWWTSWNRFDAQGMQFTQELLDGLGIDRSKITDDDEFEAALNEVEGILYLVRTTAKEGSQSGKWFINTYCDGPAVPEQMDMPVDTEGLPDVGTEAATAGEQFGNDAPWNEDSI